MRVAERSDDGFLTLRGKNRLEPELGYALLPPRLPDGGRRTLAAEERACPFCVPRAALVVADPARASAEQRVAHGVERLARHKHDQFAVHRCASLARSSSSGPLLPIRTRCC